MTPVAVRVGDIVDEVHGGRRGGEGSGGGQRVAESVVSSQRRARQGRREDEQVLRPLARPGRLQGSAHDLVLANANQVTALLNTTGQDTTPPTAAVDVTQPAVTAGSSTIQFTVTYADAQQVDASTLGNGNVTVTDPSGNAQSVTLVSTGLTSVPSLTVTYLIPAPSGSLSISDNGAYTVRATSTAGQAVKNAQGIAVAAGSIGTFTVNVPPAGTPNGPNLVCTVSARLPTSVIAGVTHSTGGETVTIVNSGNQAAKGRIVINVYASPDGTIRGNGSLVGMITRNINIRAGGRAVFVVPGFVWPASLNGTYFLVADVNATGSLAETALTDNTNLTAKSTVVVPPFVDIDNLWNMKLPKTLKMGRRVLVPVLLKNVGNVTARNTATVTLLATTDGSASGQPPWERHQCESSFPRTGKRS